VSNGEIVLQGKPGIALQFGRTMPLAASKHYVMEVEARVDAKEGTHLGPNSDRDTFAVIFGSTYWPKRSISSESLPGRYQTLRLYWTVPADGSGSTARMELGGDGQVFIRGIGIYEVDRNKPVVLGAKVVQ
jgi:hypothetical protein